MLDLSHWSLKRKDDVKHENFAVSYNLLENIVKVWCNEKIEIINLYQISFRKWMLQFDKEFDWDVAKETGRRSIDQNRIRIH